MLKSRTKRQASKRYGLYPKTVKKTDLKRTFIFILISTILISCTTKKSFVIDYNSEKLCNGIKNMTKYIENTNEVKMYFSENNTGSTEFLANLNNLRIETAKENLT